MKTKLLLGLVLVLSAIGCSSTASRRAAIPNDVLHPPPSLEQATRSLYVGMSNEELDRLIGLHEPGFIRPLTVTSYSLSGGILSITHDVDGRVVSWNVQRNAGLQVVSTVTTNGTGTNVTIVTTDTFTRGGQTNLIRVTKVKQGMVVFRRQTFCHNGQPIAYFNFVKVHFERDIQSFLTVTNSPYQLEIDYDYQHPKDVRCVWVNGTDNLSHKFFIDGWYPTNGVYYPAPDSDLEMKDVK